MGRFRSSVQILGLTERRIDMPDAIDRLNWFKHQVDQLWNGAWAAPSAPYPALNLWDDGENFHAEAELAGFKIEDIDLAVAGSELRIRGKRETPALKDGAVHRRERPSGEFSRTIAFPAEIDADRVQASLKDGVLSITLPKAPTAKPRKIKVKVLDRKK
jgi:HSP20 family protein